MIVQEPSGADIVNRLLKPGPSDPNVPLPRANLDEQMAESPSPSVTRIYGRAEGDGGVLGLKVPIPADRNASSATKPSSSLPSSESPQFAR